MTYNVIFIVNKVQTSYLNLSEEEFFNKLWEWTYEDDLWYNLEDEGLPTEEDFRDWLWGYFIPENVFHRYEEDEVDCFCFYVNSENKVLCYNNYDKLADFIVDKVKQKGYEFKLCSNS